jgi:hypothetical protein
MASTPALNAGTRPKTRTSSTTSIPSDNSALGDSHPVLLSLRIPANVDDTLEGYVAESSQNGRKVTKASVVTRALVEYFARQAANEPAPPQMSWRERATQMASAAGQR